MNIRFFILLFISGIFSNDAQQTKEPILTCDFDDGLCEGWENEEDQLFRWIVKKGPAKSTGPNFDYTRKDQRGGYLYFDDNEPSYGKAIIRTPPMDLRKPDKHCLRFMYFSRGTFPGELRIYHGNKAEYGRSISLFFRSGPRSKNDSHWIFEDISVPVFYSEQSFKNAYFRIQAMKGRREDNVVAIDDFSVTPGPCPKFKLPKTATTATFPPRTVTPSNSGDGEGSSGNGESLTNEEIAERNEEINRMNEERNRKLDEMNRNINQGDYVTQDPSQPTQPTQPTQAPQPASQIISEAERQRRLQEKQRKLQEEEERKRKEEEERRAIEEQKRKEEIERQNREQAERQRKQKEQQEKKARETQKKIMREKLQKEQEEESRRKLEMSKRREEQRQASQQTELERKMREQQEIKEREQAERERKFREEAERTEETQDRNRGKKPKNGPKGNNGGKGNKNGKKKNPKANDPAYEKCGKAYRHIESQLCCNGGARKKINEFTACCGRRIFNSKTKVCCGNNIFKFEAFNQCCGSEKIDTNSQGCCNDVAYESSLFSCNNGELVPISE